MKQICAAFVVMAALAAYPHAQAPAPEASGSWDITTVSPLGENTNTIVISKEGEKLKAVVKGDAGELPYDKIEQKGVDMTIVLTIDFQGQPMTMTYTGQLEGTKMAGDVDFGGLATGTWSAVKK